MKMRGLIIAACLVPLLSTVSFANEDQGKDQATSNPRFSIQELLAISDEDSSMAKAEIADGVQLLYFHRTLRCHTCLEMERSISELLQTEFRAELEANWLELRSIDYEDDANRTLITDFQIHRLSLLLARRVDNEVKEWRRLDRIWEIEAQDELDEYLQQEILESLHSFWDTMPDSSSG